MQVSHRDPGHALVGAARRVLRFVAGVRVEAILLVLLLLTLVAIVTKDRILERTFRLTPESIAGMTRITHTDSAVGGHSTARETGPLRWSCDLTNRGFEYPYCGYELFLGTADETHGVDLTNLRSLVVTIAYRGPSKSFRVHLKNYDPRYSVATRDDSPKFNRVENPTVPGTLQRVEFTAGDFGVADWWLRKHQLEPRLSHPQFDNITSIDIQTGTEVALGHHEFEIREIVLTSAALTDAQFYLALLAAWVAMMGAYLGFRLRTMRSELDRREQLQELAQRQAEEAEAAARQDHLTKVLNRRGIAERYADLSADEIEPMPLAVILIDIDRFKSLNDRFGHGYGDEVLSSIAALIRRNIRASDTLGRWGGEEFLVICPGIEAGDAMIVAEKLRRRIEHFHFGDCEKVTASFGVHWCPAPGPELAELVSLADIALYSAKNSGRNAARLFRAGMAKAA